LGRRRQLMGCMRWLRVAALLAVAGVVGLGVGSAQEIPRYTPERQKLVADLLKACEKAGAIWREGKGKEAGLPARLKKGRGVVGARREQLPPEVIDALVACGGRVEVRFEPLALLLLRACGQEAGDERALGMAAFLRGVMAERRPVTHAAAVARYEQAVKHFGL